MLMNTIDWPISNTILAKLLGLSENTIRVKQKQYGHILKKGVDFSRADLGVKYAPTLMTVWYKSGAIKLALRSRKATAREFLESEEIVDRVEVAEESRTLDIICTAIKGFTKFSQQYQVGPYKLDMYLKDLKIAVECDECGHTSYSEIEEIIREQFIMEELGCQFLRYDPVYPAQVGKVINSIFRAIKNSQSA